MLELLIIVVIIVMLLTTLVYYACKSEECTREEYAILAKVLDEIDDMFHCIKKY